MIGAVEPLDPRHRLVGAELARIDLLARRHHPRDGAEPHLHPRRGAVDEGRQRILEHRGIEFIRLAVGVEIGAGETRAQQRRAKIGRGAEQRVDIGVFRAAQAWPHRAATRSADRADNRSRYAARRRPAAGFASPAPVFPPAARSRSCNAKSPSIAHDFRGNAGALSPFSRMAHRAFLFARRAGRCIMPACVVYKVWSRVDETAESRAFRPQSVGRSGSAATISAAASTATAR